MRIHRPRAFVAPIVALLACGSVRRTSRTQPAAATTAPTRFVATDAGDEVPDGPAADAAVDASAPEGLPDDVPRDAPAGALPRCADLDPTPVTCAASHPGRRFAHCRWTVGPVYACGRGAPPPSARALVCICNGCQRNQDCPSRSTCMSLGHPCGPLASVCVYMPAFMGRDMGAYHDDRGHLRLGEREDYVGLTPALRAPCAP
jgi:hypothetical protein